MSRNCVQREAQAAGRIARGAALLRFVEASDTVLIESRGTVAFCFADFKEWCVWTYWYWDAVSLEF